MPRSLHETSAVQKHHPFWYEPVVPVLCRPMKSWYPWSLSFRSSFRKPSSKPPREYNGLYLHKRQRFAKISTTDLASCIQLFHLKPNFQKRATYRWHNLAFWPQACSASHRSHERQIQDAKVCNETWGLWSELWGEKPKWQAAATARAGIQTWRDEEWGQFYRQVLIWFAKGRLCTW